jgi:GNAT superfamily N-acetyltransferase
MRLVDVSDEDLPLFLRCLQAEGSVDDEAMKLRRAWYERYSKRGLRARLVMDDNGVPAGMCQYLAGRNGYSTHENSYSILCMWVRDGASAAGGARGRGYGRAMLRGIEDEARQSGADAVVAWGLDSDDWNPVSFYERMGYDRAHIHDQLVLVWKQLAADRPAPRFVELRMPGAFGSKRVHLSTCLSGWCTANCRKATVAKRVAAELPTMVTYAEACDPRDRCAITLGPIGGVLLDGKPFAPYAEPWKPQELRDEIERRYQARAR